MKLQSIIVVCLLAMIAHVHGWDSVEMEVFDVVEELEGRNFYELMNITQVQMLIILLCNIQFIIES